ncbi:MAG: class I SAM-dependent methyltransferase [bacterium]|nr:class I SAM-dependent methyltransferase [bacterium]
MEELLQCPRCSGTLARVSQCLVCGCGHVYQLVDGEIAVLLHHDDERSSHYAQQIRYFTREYHTCRRYHLAAWMRKYVEMALAHFGPPRSGAVALDVGAGSGYMSIELARAGWRVIALDLTPAGVATLLNAASAEGVRERIVPIIGSAMNLPVSAACVDAVVGNAIIEHLPDDQRFVAELARVCRAGARGMLVAPIKLRYVWPWFWLVNWYHDRRIGHLRRYDCIRFKTLLEQHGFVLDDVRYTGHGIKVAGTLLQMLFHTHRFDEWLERIDARHCYRAYGSSNVTALFHYMLAQ